MDIGEAGKMKEDGRLKEGKGRRMDKIMKVEKEVIDG